MAAPTVNAVRVRLYFDYPPPAVADCRMCWLLVDLNQCRVVADLASIIRDRFDFSRRTVLNLSMQDCYLPPTESIHVIRDNDSVRVKVEKVADANGFDCGGASEEDSCREIATRRAKRRRKDSEAGELQAQEDLDKPTRRRRRKDSEAGELQAQEDLDKPTRRRRRKDSEAGELQAQEDLDKPTRRRRRRKDSEAGELQAQEDLDKPTRRRRRKDSEAGELQAQEDLDKRRRKKKKKKEKKGRQPSAEPAPGPVPQESGAAAASGERKGGVRPGPPTSSDSSSDEEPRSSSASAKTSSAAQQGDRAQSGPSSSVPGGRAAAGRRPSDSPGSTGPGPERGSPERAGEAPVPRARAESSSSDSSSGDEPLIRPPGLRGGDADRAPRGVAGAARGLGRGPAPGAGGVRGRGDGRFPWRGLGPRGGRGRARAGPRNHVYYNYNGGEQRRDGDALTNSSVVLQNPAADAPKRDYSLLPLLAAPPAVGQLIAFKLLELTENYSPEVSDYKEGRIVGFDQSTRQLELELLSSAPAPAEPGKFDLVYHTPDGAEIVEYAVSRGSKLTERWDSLLEPRLIVDGAEGGPAGAAD